MACPGDGGHSVSCCRIEPHSDSGVSRLNPYCALAETTEATHHTETQTSNEGPTERRPPVLIIAVDRRCTETRGSRRGSRLSRPACPTGPAYCLRYRWR